MLCYEYVTECEVKPVLCIVCVTQHQLCYEYLTECQVKPMLYIVCVTHQQVFCVLTLTLLVMSKNCLDETG